MLKDKLLSGYWYSLNGSSVKVHTGKAGVEMYLEACEEEGLSAKEAGDGVMVYTDYGPISLSNVIKKKTRINEIYRQVF